DCFGPVEVSFVWKSVGVLAVRSVDIFGSVPSRAMRRRLTIEHLVSGLRVPRAVLPESPLQRALCTRAGSLLKAGLPPRLAAVHRRAMPAYWRLAICAKEAAGERTRRSDHPANRFM